MSPTKRIHGQGQITASALSELNGNVGSSGRMDVEVDVVFTYVQ